MEMAMLPNFIIIGVFKAGTTSLHQYFDQHPDVFMTTVKEPNYFSFDENNSSHVNKNNSDYRVRTLEAYNALFEGAKSGAKLGEASPSYFRSSLARERIRQTVPSCKLILSLRNPVDRAYSAYQMAVRTGKTTVDINISRDCDQWIVGSLYSEPLMKYSQLFGDTNLRVILFDDILNAPASVMADLFRFVGVRDDYAIDVSYRFNPGGLPKSQSIHRFLNGLKRIPGLQKHTPKAIRRQMSGIRDRNLLKAPPLDMEIKSRWLEFFREDILRTEELIHRDLSHWLIVK